MARLFIQNGADVNVKNEYGATPMLHVCKYFKQNITNSMIENGADVNAQGNIGNTSLHMAGEHSDWSIYFGVSRMLLLNGANANVNNNIGETPLHRACREGCLEVVQLLLSLGANVNVEDLQGLTLSAEDGRGGLGGLLWELNETQKNLPSVHLSWLNIFYCRKYSY